MRLQKYLRNNSTVRMIYRFTIKRIMFAVQNLLFFAIFITRRKIQRQGPTESPAQSRCDLFIFLDSHIAQHCTVNRSMLEYHRRAFPDKRILLLNAPTLLLLENEVYFCDHIYDFDYIIKMAKRYEAIGFANYKNVGGAEVYSLIGDTDRSIVHQVFNRIASIADDDLDDFLELDPFIGDMIWVDLSLVLKNSKRDCGSKKQNDIIRLILFHYELIKCFLNDHVGIIHCVFNNSIYSLNHASAKYIQKIRGDVVVRYLTPLHEGYQLARFKVAQNSTKDAFYRRKFFLNYRDKLLTRKAFIFVKSFLDANVFGNSPFKYSPDPSEVAALSVHEVLDIDPQKPIYVYFTSSPDEELVSDILNEGLYANNTMLRRPYSDEVEAIRDLAEETSTLDVHLIVRFHPRLDVEERVPLQCDQYKEFLSRVEEIAELFPHVRLIYANQRISSYWLAGWASHNFSVRSSMGNVLPLLGLSVVLMSDNRGSYVAGFEQFIVRRKSEFFDGSSAFIDLRMLADFVCGFYITNCHASFGVDELNDSCAIDLYKASVDTGYSSLSFISDASADLYESCLDDETMALLEDYLGFLSERVKQMSFRQDFPHEKLCNDLIEMLAELG